MAEPDPHSSSNTPTNSSCSTMHPSSPHPAIHPEVPASHHPDWAAPPKNSTKTTPAIHLPDTETAAPDLQASAALLAQSEQAPPAAAEPASPPDTETAAPHSTAPADPAPPDSCSSCATVHHCPSRPNSSSSYSSTALPACPPASGSTAAYSAGSPASARTPPPRPNPPRTAPATTSSCLY